MTKNDKSIGAGRPARRPGDPRPQAAPSDERFPPLSTSLESLLSDGSDREFRRLIYSLISFSALIVRHRECFGGYIGVTGPQYVMMAIMSLAGTVTVGQIAEQMDVSSQFVTVEINKLIKRNIVKKVPNPDDRRSVHLSLTSQGRNLIRELGPVRRESNDLMYRSLTGDKAKVLQEIMGALVQDAKIAMHELEAPHILGRKAPTASLENNGDDVTTRSGSRMTKRRRKTGR